MLSKGGLPHCGQQPPSLTFKDPSPVETLTQLNPLGTNQSHTISVHCLCLPNPDVSKCLQDDFIYIVHPWGGFYNLHSTICSGWDVQQYERELWWRKKGWNQRERNRGRIPLPWQKHVQQMLTNFIFTLWLPHIQSRSVDWLVKLMHLHFCCRKLRCGPFTFEIFSRWSGI